MLSSGKFPLKKMEVFLNGIYLDSVDYPLGFSFIPASFDNIKDENEIKIISYDSVYNRTETTVNFRVK